MAKYKYQMLNFNLFDYKGVENHLEKMAAKGWRFDSVGLCWKFLKSEPKNLKYSVTYFPKHSDFAPGPSEEQLDMEAYCREAGWVKAGSWMQMQIFCTDNPDAVPIETDEELRLEIIHKSMKKNFLLSHTLLLLVFLMNAFTTYNLAKNNWIEFLADGSRHWSCAIFMWGIFLLAVDVGYYFNWHRKAKKSVADGGFCPEPKGYRKFNLVAWGVLAILMLGMFSSYNGGMLGFMAMYMAGLFLVIFLVRKVRDYFKDMGMSRGWNIVVTLLVDVVLAFALVGVLTKAVFAFDWKISEEPEMLEVYEVGDYVFAMYDEELPMYAEDLMDVDYTRRSCFADEKSSALLEYGEYNQRVIVERPQDPVVMFMYYEMITVKADFLYDSVLEAFYNREFKYADEGEREKTEYRLAYESGAGRLYRVYYEGLPMAHEWLLLSDSKIVPITIYVEDLTEQQMETIVKKLAE